jgi:F-type H+-transporting ATPase subunit delta
MSRSAAKKYAKVLTQQSNKEQVNEAKEYLLAITTLFKNPKFKDTVLSPLISVEEKSALLLGQDNANQLLTNLVKLLLEKDRIALIPYIYEELRYADAVASNRFEGFVYAAQDVDAATMDELKNNISKRVDSTIDFKQVKCDEEGFRVEVPDLGIEVSFSQERLKSQLIQHILRGI